ncbi:hydroxysteroid 11-beta-dehydrogenase 1-like protein precursor [Oryzias latipes]|uniref:11-beta-hydroxysteroid dehydrogenase type 3 n=1 Tax=Oryzias latipes TaxID=8090 RepID=Q6PUF1_ORYLA|nr:hydroxysteroid 11-beta-dehydrogenase 1-like protein precursor [Oryzias latipes]AAS89258.1 11-beta-hydroxysteroid dehydrogenase type 3 [Oryzias latipes]
MAFTKVLIVSLCVVFLAVKWTSPTFDPESIRGARVLVTGASTGIGEQMAYHYARFGAQVVITARREKVLQQVVEKCLSLGAQKAVYIAADMSTDADPDKVVDFALEELGGLDYLVLNHIGSIDLRMWDGDHEQVQQLMKINFHSYVQMAGRALPFLERTGGALVVVSSLCGRVSTPYVAPYTSTKFALNGFFGSLRHELVMKKSNVSISICTLGLIDTASAMEKIREFTDMSAYPATDAALNIIITGATRQRELFYPWFTQVMALTKDWCPSLSDYMIQKFYKTS